MEVRPCDHCGKKRLLVAKVTSELYTMLVCFECGRLAVRLVSQDPRGESGQIKVESLEEESRYTDWWKQLARN